MPAPPVALGCGFFPRSSPIALLASRHMSRSPCCAKRLRRFDNRVRNSSMSRSASIGSGSDELPRFFKSSMDQFVHFMKDDLFFHKHSLDLAISSQKLGEEFEHSMRLCAAIICCSAAERYLEPYTCANQVCGFHKDGSISPLSEQVSLPLIAATASAARLDCSATVRLAHGCSGARLFRRRAHTAVAKLDLDPHARSRPPPPAAAGGPRDRAPAQNRAPVRRDGKAH